MKENKQIWHKKYACSWTLSVPQISQFSLTLALAKLFLPQNRQYQGTNIQRWFFTKYRLMPAYRYHFSMSSRLHAQRTRLNYYNCKIDYPVCTTKLIKQCLPWDIPSSCFQMLVEKHVHPHTIPEVLLQKSEILVERTGAVLYTGVFH